MEFIDLYDDNRVKLNKSVDRLYDCEKNENRQVVHICIFDDDGRLLIQKRQSTKRLWKNLWDVSVAGGSLAGETSRQSAARELFEELGIVYDFQGERPYLTVNFQHGFDDFYFIHLNVNLSDLTLQASEVQEVKWATRQEVLILADAGEFVPYVRSFLISLFDLKDHRGVLTGDDTDAK